MVVASSFVVSSVAAESSVVAAVVSSVAFAVSSVAAESSAAFTAVPVTFVVSPAAAVGAEDDVSVLIKF